MLAELLIGIAHALTDRTDEARHVLQAFQERSAKEYVPPIAIAMLHSVLGEIDESFKWIQRAYEERDGFLLQLKVNPLFEALRSDPRYTALLKKIGLDK